MRIVTFALAAAASFMATNAINGQQPAASPMNAVAEGYVKLVLAVGQHDSAYVDAYYGPDAWKSQAERQKKPLEDIDAEAERLIRDAGPRPAGADEMTVLRHDYLVKQLQALRARVRMLSGGKMTFDEESAALYDAVAPTHPDSYFQAALDDLNRRLPGNGSLIERSPKTDCRRSLTPPLPRVDDAPSSTSSFRQVRASKSSTSPISRGAATTGIRGITTA